MDWIQAENFVYSFEKKSDKHILAGTEFVQK